MISCVQTRKHTLLQVCAIKACRSQGLPPVMHAVGCVVSRAVWETCMAGVPSPHVHEGPAVMTYLHARSAIACLVTHAGSVTSAEKDKIESEVGLFVKACGAQIERLKEQVAAAAHARQEHAAGPKLNEQTTAHYHGVVSARPSAPVCVMHAWSAMPPLAWLFG